MRCLSSFCFEDQVIFSTVYLDSENDVRSLIKAHTYLHTTNNGLMPHTDVATGLVASLRYTEHFNRAKLLETKVVDAYVWLTMLVCIFFLLESFVFKLQDSNCVACVLFAGCVHMCVVYTHCSVELCFATRGRQRHLSVVIHHVEDL